MTRLFFAPLAALLATMLLLAAAPPIRAAEEPSVNPGINAHYRDSRWEQWVGIFERDGREVYDHRHEILAALDLRKAMTVADVGAGTGLFTRLFARAVGPEGRVYAVDITPTFVENTVRTAREQGLDNVVGVINSPREVMLPGSSVDLAFLSDTYHHFEYPHSTMRSLYRAMKPGGELVVIDFRRIPGVSSPWVMGHVRAGKATFVEEIEAAGFRLAGEEDFMEGQYFLRFRKQSP